MTLTPKEHSLLLDLKSQEQLCIEKYGKYEQDANDPCLKSLFKSIKSTEEGHLSTVSRIMSGEEVTTNTAPTAVSQKLECQMSSCSEEQKKCDAFLCKDALAMEKHVSGLYDTSIFEFSSPTLRDTLNHIQKEEQNHGEQLYEYMSKNNMYS
jgi:spore coat protein CotF